MSQSNSGLARQETMRSNSGNEQSRETSGETFGDTLSKKKISSKIRICCQNVNGFLPKDDGVKKELIRDFINENKIDIFMMSEVNVN